MQHEWGPYKARRLGHGHTERKDHVKIQGGDVHLQTKERGLKKPMQLIP